MKRLLFLTLLLAIASSRLSAQTGLNVAPLFTKFSGKGTPDVTSVTLRGTKSGHLYYGIYQFPIRDGRNRYLFYRNNTLSKNSEPSLTLIYMEGTATLETLKRTFSK